MSLEKLTTKFDIEMAGSTKRYVVAVKQADRGTRYIEATLRNHGAEYSIPTGSEVTAYVRKDKGAIKYIPCTFSGAKVYAELPSSAIDETGVTIGEIEVKSMDAAEVATSCTFEIYVEGRVKGADATLSEDELTILDAQLKKYTEAEAARAKAEESRANAEKSRASAENSRVSAESSRVSAESSRVSAESSRVSAESSRASAENSRVKAESSREQASAQALNKANEAVEVANQVNEASYIYDADADVKYAYSIYAQRGIPHMALTKITT